MDCVFRSYAAGAAILGTLLAASPSRLTAEEPALDAPALQLMVQNLGFSVKTLGSDPAKPKYEITIEKGGLNVPLALEISQSGRFIWITAFLGETSALNVLDTRAVKMLEKNFTIQPSFFYITRKGNLMLGIYVENRGVTPAILRWRIDKLVEDVVSTRDVWTK